MCLAFLFVRNGRQEAGCKSRDLCLDVDKRSLSQTARFEKLLLRHLDLHKRQPLVVDHRLALLKLDLRCYQAPQGSEVYIEDDLAAIEFVEVAVLPRLRSTHPLKQSEFIVVEVHLDEFCHRVLAFGHTETLLEHSRPVIRERITHLSNAKACLRNVGVKDLQMSARRR